MYVGSQVQDNDWTDVADQGDHNTGIRNRDEERYVFKHKCTRCKTHVGKNVSYEEHLKICFPDGILNIDYVECKLCKFAGKKITQHVKNVHHLTKEQYSKKYNAPLIASNSSKCYGMTGSRARVG